MANRTKDEEATLVAEIDQTLAAIQALGIRIPFSEEVREYLLLHPMLTHYLFDISRKSHNHFQARAQLSLELYRDPEIERTILILYVRQEPYEDSLIDEIDQIAEDSEPILSDGSGRILITTDYQPPERG